MTRATRAMQVECGRGTGTPARVIATVLAVLVVPAALSAGVVLWVAQAHTATSATSGTAAAASPAPTGSAGSAGSAGPVPSMPSVPSTAPNAVAVGRPGVPRGASKTAVNGLDRLNDGDPPSVAAAFATTSWTWDTRLDRSPQDAVRRAAALMTPTAAAREAAVTGGGGADWAALARHDGYTVATTSPDTEPPPPVVDGRTARRVFVTVTPYPSTPDPSTPYPATSDPVGMPVEQWTVVVELQRTSDGRWRVEASAAQPTAGAGGPS